MNPSFTWKKPLYYQNEFFAKKPTVTLDMSIHVSGSLECSDKVKHKDSSREMYGAAFGIYGIRGESRRLTLN